MSKASSRPATGIIQSAGFCFALLGLLSGAANILVLISPIYMFQVYDRVLVTHSVETLFFLSVIALVCIAALAVFDAIRGVALARLGRWWDETVRPDLLDASLASARVKGVRTGASLGDLQQVRNFVGGAAMVPYLDAPWAPLFILLIFMLHPVLGFVAVGSALLLIILAVANDRVTRGSIIGLAGRQAANAMLAASALRHCDVVHAMGMQPALVGLHERRQRELNAEMQKGVERGAWISGVSKSARIGVQVAILGVGAWLVTRNELTGGGMIAASIILGRALAPIEQGIGSWRAFVQAREAHSRIKAALAAVPLVEEPTALPAPQGRLSVENLTLLLPGQDKPALRQVSFTLPAGKVLALVGPSAAGKSTLCRLLVGSWSPTAGHVRLDGADLVQWRAEDRARYVGYLPQSIELFGGTVRQNIGRFLELPDAMIVEAAQRANCHEMILRLPKGYDTEIGEGGAFLSGGQRQRIGLARSLLGEPRLVVLDEPNSNLDQEGESALIAAIADAKERGTTVVLVSHRFAMMRVVDMIGVLRGGGLEKFGPRDVVLEELQAVPKPVEAVVGGDGREVVR